jgi:hypothetical protein
MFRAQQDAIMGVGVESNSEEPEIDEVGTKYNKVAPPSSLSAEVQTAPICFFFNPEAASFGLCRRKKTGL